MLNTTNAVRSLNNNKFLICRRWLKQCKVLTIEIFAKPLWLDKNFLAIPSYLHEEQLQCSDNIEWVSSGKIKCEKWFSSCILILI